jgi:inward rectifier potassium channel
MTLRVSAKHRARPRTEKFKAGGKRGYEIRVVGVPNPVFRDLYHAFLRRSWGFSIGAIVAGFLSVNLVFAVLFTLVGGIQGARPGSFIDAFFFSVQTMGTIGYGAMFPVGALTNSVVVAESITSVLVTALATGLVFSKFSLSSARILFTKEVVISLMDGVPTLMFRLGNERSSHIVEAQLRVSMVRTEKTKEGVTFYRMYDLALTRDRSQAFSRSWTAMHRIDSTSPLYGETPESLADNEVELLATVMGTDDTSLQPVHARRQYMHYEIVWGARHADILSETDDGDVVLDLRKFHDVTPTEATDSFPYSSA